LKHEVDTERARAALRESEAHAASLFEQTAVGIAETDMEGKLLRANDRYCEILGRTRADLLGRDVGTLIHPDDLERDQAMLAGLRETGQSFDLENRYCRPDGSACWVHKTVSPVQLGGDASAQHILAVVVDIENRKKAEEEVREGSRRKDEFLAMLAHELRNPLAPISAAAELMSLVPLDAARLKQTSQVISRQVRHMTGLVDDLLDVSRVTRGLVDVQRTTQDMQVVAANAIKQVLPLIEGRGHRLVLDLSMTPALVLGDQKRLVQILSNLLNNAAKYTPNGGILTLRTEVDASTVTLRVQDNGIGIKPDVAQRVFDLFAQAERTPDRTEGGLGIGLALVKSLVELHGGTVDCHSDGPGKGSCFTVTLPRLQVVPVPPEPDAAAPRIAAPAPGALQVLVVDDNVDAAHMLRLLLEANGYVVRVEHHPCSAFEQALRQPPDVAILDIGLPDIDGNELARMLRARSETQDCMLVAVTGYSQEHDRKAILEAGFDHHMAMPANGERLLGLLKQVAQAKR
jgi:PAS domain S-box-containing protein